MTLSSSTTACHQSGRPQSGRAVSMTGTVPPAPPFGDATGHSPLYVVEPDIPEDMRCAHWRWRRQPLPELGLLARAGRCVAALAPLSGSAVGRWGPPASLHPIASSGMGTGARAVERAQHDHRVEEE